MQLRIGWDEGDRIRRQTLPLVSGATVEAINNFLDKLTAVISVPLFGAVKVIYETIR